MIKSIIYILAHLFFFYVLLKTFFKNDFNIFIILLWVSILIYLPLFNIDAFPFTRLVGIIGLFFISTNLNKDLIGTDYKKYFLLIILLWIFVLIAYLNSTSREFALNKVLNFTFNYFLLLFIIPLTSKLEDIPKLYRTWVLLAIISSIFTIIQAYFGEKYLFIDIIGKKWAIDSFHDYTLESGEFSGLGLFDHRSHNALFISIALFYLLLLSLSQRIKIVFSVPLIFLFIIAIILTRARLANLLMIVGLIVILVLKLKYARQHKISSLMYALIFVLVLTVFGNTFFVANLINPLKSRFEAALISNIFFDNERIYTWSTFMNQNGITLYDLLHPFGLGFGFSPPDNVFLTVGFEIGLIALVLFVVLHFIFIVKSAKLAVNFQNTICEAEYVTTFLAILIITIHLFFGNLYFYEQIYLQVVPYATFLLMINNTQYVTDQDELWKTEKFQF